MVRLIVAPLNSAATTTNNLISNVVMILVKHKVWLVVESSVYTNSNARNASLKKHMLNKLRLQMILTISCTISVRGGEPTPVKLGAGKGSIRSD